MPEEEYKYFVFDFDGVICDSTNECMVTAWNAWDRWNGGDDFRNNLSSFSKDEISSFRPLRPYVRGAGEYYSVMKNITSGKDNILNQKDYDNYLENEKEFIEPFKNIFLSERQRLRGENIDNWIALHEIYPDVIRALKFLHLKEKLFIATLKDKESVFLILKSVGINLLESEILDQSQIKSKLEALNMVCRDKELKKEDLLFLDDNVTHLIDPHLNGYNVLHTSWGNCLEEHHEEAKKIGMTSLKGLDENTLGFIYRE